MLKFFLKSKWQRAGSATYMPHSQQRHAYKSNTHKIRRNLKTKYNDNKKQRSVFGMYTEVVITQRISEWRCFVLADRVE